MVRLTDEEAEALAEYLFITLIPYIQDPENWVDNLEWVRNMANVWHKCDRRQEELVDLMPNSVQKLCDTGRKNDAAD